MNRNIEELTVKNPNVSLSAEKIQEEPDYVNAAVRTVDNMEATSAVRNQKCPSFIESVPPLVLCWVPLLLIMSLRIYFTSVMSSNTELKEENQQLKTMRNNLTEQIRKLEVNLNELNISRAQWSLDNYCPKYKGRQCEPCQIGWTFSSSQSSCYAINYAQPPNQKTWEEAREDCRGKNSDLAVIVNEEEKTFTTDNSWSNPNIRGYWIGLRGENRWKWVDGSLLNQSSWIQQSPTDGSCVTSLQVRGWESVNCSEKNAWICKKKALSV